MTPVSFDPESFVEGGAVPVDRNLTWREARFDLFDYPDKVGEAKAPLTTCARLTLKDDDGNEYVQHYSITNPERLAPSEDGKMLVGEAPIVKTSNFGLLMTALKNAGFPMNRFVQPDGNWDISAADGLYAYHIGLVEPERKGLDRADKKPKTISVPSRIIKLPWEKQAKKAAAPVANPAAKAATAAPADQTGQSGDGDDMDISARVVKFVGKHLGADGSITRQKLAMAALKDFAKDPDRDALAVFLYSPEFHVSLLAAGYKVSGETISKA